MWGCQLCGAEEPDLEGIVCFDAVPSDDARDAAAYARFLARRSRYPVADRYAAFQPFNEAGRTWQAFRELLGGLLQPGDVILDLSNRTGWTGAELAGAFPQQTVLSLWEGDADVLGHRGFRHWYGGARCPVNLHLAFLRPGERLPLASGSVRFVHGHDVLHHREPEAFLAEVSRVLSPGGCALFPHVHISDADPVPWFQRGGTLRSAAMYRRALQDAAGAGCCGLLLGEATLFADMMDGRALCCEPGDGADCNAVAMIVPASWRGRRLAGAPYLPAEPGRAALMVNPLLRVDPGDGTVTIPGDGLAGHMLPRHPVYERHLRRVVPRRLDRHERQVCYWAARLPDLAAIASRLGRDVTETVERLVRGEVLAARILDASTLRLQRCHAMGIDLPDASADHPAQLWVASVEQHAQRPFLLLGGGEALSYGDADAVIRAVARRMARAGVGPGSAVLVADGLSAEAVIVIWAAFLRGATVVVADPQAPPPRIDDMNVPVVFARNQAFLCHEAELVCPDGVGHARGTPLPLWYSDQDLEGDDPVVGSQEPSGPALVLFTSGSTGAPKGVLLSWQGLARSARHVAWWYRWGEDDRLLSLGGLHTMSGLRNPCLAAVAAGAAISVDAVHATALTLAESMRRDAITILGAAPATVQQLTASAERIGSMPALRLAMCTGSRLPDDLRRRFVERFAVPLRNYYGLTETSGFCLGEPYDGGAGIGVPVDALVSVVDPAGAEVATGAVGELLVHSANLMLGYLGHPPAAWRDGWYRTGDLVRRGADGGYELCGRLRDIAKNGHGEIVSLRQVEDALLALDGVADAAVISTVGDDGLERMLAWVAPQKPPSDEPRWIARLRDDLQAAVGPRRMPAEVRLLTALPRTSNGKLRPELLPGGTP